MTQFEPQATSTDESRCESSGKSNHTAKEQLEGALHERSVRAFSGKDEELAIPTSVISEVSAQFEETAAEIDLVQTSDADQPRSREPSTTPTEVEVDQEEIIEGIKAAGIKVRDFAYEMRVTSPSVVRMVRAPKIFNPVKYYMWFRFVKSKVHDKRTSFYALDYCCSALDLLYLIIIGWVAVSECNWMEARHALGKGLMLYQDDPYPFEVIDGATLPSEEEVRKHHERWPTLKLETSLAYDWDEDVQDHTEHGPFGPGVVDSVSLTMREAILSHLKDPTSKSLPGDLPDAVRGILRPLISHDRRRPRSERSTINDITLKEPFELHDASYIAHNPDRQVNDDGVSALKTSRPGTAREVEEDCGGGPIALPRESVGRRTMSDAASTNSTPQDAVQIRSHTNRSKRGHRAKAPRLGREEKRVPVEEGDRRHNSPENRKRANRPESDSQLAVASSAQCVSSKVCTDPTPRFQERPSVKEVTSEASAVSYSFAMPRRDEPARGLRRSKTEMFLA